MADSQPMAPMPAEEALERLLSHATAVSEVEQLETINAGRRVLARDVMSQLDVPPMDNSQMDGYALRASDVIAPGSSLPVSQRIAAGHIGQALAPGTAARIFTGAMIPQGADTVVMQEQCTAEGDSIRISHVPRVGEWVRLRGCDIRAGDVILQAGQRLRPQDLGLAASVGLKHLDVRRRLKVAVFFTGDELAMPGQPLKPGAIYNSNRFVMVDLLQRLGCDLIDLGLVPDSLAATRAALAQAAIWADVVITSGGVSVGEEDHIRPAVLSMGALDLWQLAIKPGKPLAFGHVRRAVESQPPAYFFGLPGNPVSSFVTFVMFVRPFLLRMQGVRDVSPRALLLPAAFDWPNADRRREYLRAAITDNADVAVYSNQNSAVLSSVAWAGGLLDNPPGNTISKGDLVRYIPFSELLD